MHWDKFPNYYPTSLPEAQPGAEIRTRPYQGVRVRDPVKELLRRKRSAAASKTTPPTEDVGTFNNQGLFVSEFSTATSEGGFQCSGWRAVPTSSSTIPGSVLPWSTLDCSQQDASAQSQSYSSAPALTTDLYMQTLCPSYTMLTYTHAPLLTNFGTIPVAPAPTPLPQMHSDSAVTYLPWATMPAPVQFPPGSAALSGSPLVHVPLATMIPQLDLQVSNSELQSQEPPLEPGTEVDSLHEDPEVEQGAPSLLDKLLEEQKEDGEKDKDSYNDSIFVTNV